jgi:hypothetical protein
MNSYVADKQIIFGSGVFLASNLVSGYVIEQ